MQPKIGLKQVLLLFWVLFVQHALTIKCEVAYGQRGKRYSDKISWIRNCPETLYCFEAVTSDIEQVKVLIDYPWEEYYDQYFIRSCGGDLGLPVVFHPWRGKPKSYRTILGSVKVNVTTPEVVTGHGGTEELDLRYTCRKDLCSGTIRTFTISTVVVLVSVVSSLLLL